MTDQATFDDAEVIREYVPFADRGYVHGVTFDGRHVWFARDDELVAFDPSSEQVVRRLPVPNADAGTAFDGEHLYQVAKEQIVIVEPASGRVVRTLRAPGGVGCSGMAWADGALFIGRFRELCIHEVDAKTGDAKDTLACDRLVTGVSCVDGALWHAASFDGKPSELRRLADDGTVIQTLRVAVEAISGMERTPSGEFWCGGEKGTLRLVRRKHR